MPLQTNRQTDTDRHKHRQTQTHTQTYTYTCTHARTHAHTHTHTHTQTHTYEQTHTHKHTPTCRLGLQQIIALFGYSLINQISGYQISIWIFVNSHVLHAALLFVSICKLVIGIKYINEYPDIRSLRHTNIRSLKTSNSCSPNVDQSNFRKPGVCGPQAC